ncbi:hypothetical protein [Amycolatopsis azurea]|uniref:Uncharacterized protein n=1 Tax=Amycolatopsis azurea DSM 43854 TaxID=1238180 RepID=M2QL30_9PSEU|nr:hypothetical protein [Amycolatopsis azurea]EMD27396.1 hypothetical protein C791_2408 [Amycolatopsis azurea DSM 43854]OOC03797.1 hypothetical protein B0293_26415 [Amycolatopsis azurea DSM 43854]
MATREEDLVHIAVEESFWSGDMTAACGITANVADVETAYFGFWFATYCPECRRLAKKTWF